MLENRLQVLNVGDPVNTRSQDLNQFMIRGESPEETNRILKGIQESGICWCGGSVWEGVPVIRISVCSHATTREDIDRSVEAFRIAMTR